MTNPDLTHMHTYDRDGNIIPDDYYDRTKYSRREFKWGTEQRVGRTKVGDYLVSTVWLLGIDHGYGDEPPILFETMVLGTDDEDHPLRRYATEEQAMRGHLAAVDRLRTGLPPFDDDEADW
jgi:hypothetical protein